MSRTPNAAYRARCVSKAAAFAMLFLSLIASSTSGQDTAVRFGVNESPPYWSTSLPHGGLCGEILHALSREINLESALDFKPIPRLMEDDSHNVTGNPMFYLANRDFGATVPIALSYSALFYYRPNQKQDITFTRLADLKGYRIGVLKGTIVDHSYFDKADIRFEESYSEQSLFKKLKLGRLDICICIDLVGHLTVREVFPEEASHFVAINLPRSVTPIAIMLAEKYPNAKELAAKYTRGLEVIIENGTYQAILEKYYGRGRIPTDWFSALARFADMYGSYGECP